MRFRFCFLVGLAAFTFGLFFFNNLLLRQSGSLKRAPLVRINETEEKEEDAKAGVGFEKIFRRRVQVWEPVAADVTLVTVYFKLEKSKHGADAYKSWIRAFFNSATTTPLVVFTDRRTLPELADMFNSTSNPKTIYVFESIWQLTRLIEAERNNNVSIEQAYRGPQRHLDPEKAWHWPELYAIWNAKPYIMKLAAARNLYSSRFFLYSDIGAFRLGLLPNWPDVRRVSEIGEALGDRVLFGQVAEWKQSVYRNFIEGGFFAGNARALDAYFDHFYAIHDQLLAEGKFVGKDQTIMNMHVAYNHTELSCALWVPDYLRECKNIDNAWFFYQFYLYNERKSPPIAASNTAPCRCNSRLYRANASSIACNNFTEHIAPPVTLDCIPIR